MKKKIWIPILVVVILAILFVPIPSGVYKDGGTREYTALTYKIVDWNRLTDGGVLTAKQRCISSLIISNQLAIYGITRKMKLKKMCDILLMQKF